MFQFDPQIYVQNNLWRIVSLQVFIFFLLVCLVIKKQWRRIYYSLNKEKAKIFYQTISFLSIITIIHFVLKFFSPFDKAEKIQDLISVINSNKKNYWNLIRIIFGLCVLAPIVEEFVYRYLVFNIFGKKNIFPYLISFFTFIFGHYCWRGESIRALFLQYSVASFGLIYIYKKSNWNILSPILFHSFINIIFIALTLINPNSFLI